MADLLKSDRMVSLLHDALSGVEDLPDIDRNETLDAAMEALDGGAKTYLNLVEGTADELGQLLGADEPYELELPINVEIYTKASSETDSRASFGSLVSNISSALEGAGRQALTPHYCGLEIQTLKMEPVAASGVKQGILPVSLTFFSDRPF